MPRDSTNGNSSSNSNRNSNGNGNGNGNSNSNGNINELEMGSLTHTCHILHPSEIDLGLFRADVTDLEGKHLFHRIG